MAESKSRAMNDKEEGKRSRRDKTIRRRKKMDCLETGTR